MKRRTQKTKIFSNAMLGGVLVMAAATGAAVFGGQNASAVLEYSKRADVSFTFNASLTVELSGDLIISELAPGNYADSNEITVGVVTNSTSGYVLQATAGTKTTNTQLVNDADSAYYFSSLDTEAALESMNDAGANTWGYAYSKDAGSTWSNYSGLPLDGNDAADERGKGGVTLLNSTALTTNNTVNFKIAAKAAQGQATGDYKNVVNFYAVANPAVDTYNMQEVGTWGSTIAAGTTVTAIDTRDDKSYKVAKLADGNLWMTQNLDLFIDSTKTYTPADTDVKADWQPMRSTYAKGSDTWEWTTTEPESYDPGEVCWNGTIDTSYSGTLDDMTNDCSGTDKQYQIGNYYNWTAAIAMNDSSAYEEDGTDADQSICPAGWRLPTLDGDKSFQNLIDQTGFEAGETGNIHLAPAWFVYGGIWLGSSGSVGGVGAFWSSVAQDSGSAYILYFYADGDLYPQDYYGRYFGNSVRCVAR